MKGIIVQREVASHKQSAHFCISRGIFLWLGTRLLKACNLFLPVLTWKKAQEEHRAVPCSSIAFALQRGSDLRVPRNEAARPRSQFPHLCFCERFIYSPPSILLQQNRQNDRDYLYINRSQIFVSKFWYTVFAVWRSDRLRQSRY